MLLGGIGYLLALHIVLSNLVGTAIEHNWVRLGILGFLFVLRGIFAFEEGKTAGRQFVAMEEALILFFEEFDVLLTDMDFDILLAFIPVLIAFFKKIEVG